MKLRAIFLLGAACAACCAPLLIPILAGSTALGTVTGFTYASFELGLLVAVLVVLAWMIYRYRATRVQTSCTCPPDGGCHTGSACSVPVKQTSTLT